MRSKQVFISIFALAVLCSHVISAQEQVRDLPSFSAVSLRVSGTVYLTQGSPQSVRVEASEPTLEDLVTEVKDRTLVIRFNDSNFFTRRYSYGKIKVYVTVPDIEVLSVSGSGNIESGSIKSQNLELTISGSGNLLISNLESENVKSTISGSGNILLNGGNAREFSTSVSGSGSIKAADFQAADADIRVSGSGNCTLTAQKSLKARVSGSGGVAYKGSPQLDTNVSGSGRIKKL